MKITTIQIENFKTFNEKIILRFDQGINLVIGENNSGKSSLLDLLRLENYDNNPHITPFKSQVGKPSSVLFEYEIKKDEFWSLVDQRENNLISLRTYFQRSSDRLDYRRSSNTFLDSNNIRIWGELNSTFMTFSYINRFGETGDSNRNYRISISPNIPVSQPVNKTIDLRADIHPRFLERIFTFSSERVNISQESVADSTIQLSANGSNLPSVLNTMANENIGGFTRVISDVNKLFPEVKHISTPIKNGVFRIKIWLTESSQTVNQVSYYLDQCGTGMHQIILLFTALNLTDSQKVFLIDEPQTFLHPKSIKQLFHILKKDYANHQYIIATHSPFVIKASEPCSITYLYRNEELVTVSSQIPSDDKNNLRGYMREIGIAFSDIFGIDRIIWVEGKSDKVILTYLSQRFGIFAEDVEFKSVVNTGDFECWNDKLRDLTINLYEEWTEGVFNPQMTLLFDGDKKKVIDEKFKRLSNINSNHEPPHFLTRLMLENYLVDEEGIIKYFLELQSEDKSIPDDLEEIIHRLFTDHGHLISKEQEDFKNENGLQDWKEYIHAKKFLNEIYLEVLSRDYSQITDGLDLCKYLVEIESSEVKSLVDELLLLKGDKE